MEVTTASPETCPECSPTRLGDGDVLLRFLPGDHSPENTQFASSAALSFFRAAAVLLALGVALLFAGNAAAQNAPPHHAEEAEAEWPPDGVDAADASERAPLDEEEVPASDFANSADDSAPVFGATAVVRAPMPATNAEDPTAAGSAVDAQNRGRALEDASEALVEVPGLKVNSTGGAGAPALVALRGAEVGHTSVLLGAIPLNTPDSGAFDISLLPLSALDRIEVYRGGAPAWYSEGAIGGVLRLVPATAAGDLLQATAGYGSFGRAELRVTGAASRSEGMAPTWFGHVRILRADNDYSFVDDGQTRFDESDDRVLRQQNADVLQGDALMHAAVDGLGGRLSFLFAGHSGTEGVPGPLATPTRRVRRKLVRGLVGAAYDRETVDEDGERESRVQLVASASHQLNSLTDLYAELGTSKQVDSDDVWQRFFLRAAGARTFFDHIEPSVIATLAVDRYRPENPAAFSMPPRPSERTTGTVTVEPRVFGTVLGKRAELRPSVRMQWSETAIRANSGLDSLEERQLKFSPTYRLAAAIEAARGLSLSSSAATGTRVPSISELFGDRVFQEANPRLAPERSKAVDVGAVLRRMAGRLRGSVEARGFALFIEDLIRFERTAQYTVRPENIASGRIYGLELGAQAHYGERFSLSSSLTAMHTENVFGKQLPLRPPLQALVRPQMQFHPDAVDELAAFIELQHVSFVYLDEANLTHLPGRTLFSAGTSLTFWSSHLTVDARVNNVLDAQAIDVLSRPLPGRDYRMSLTLRDDLGT